MLGKGGLLNDDDARISIFLLWGPAGLEFSRCLERVGLLNDDDARISTFLLWACGLEFSRCLEKVGC